MDTQIPGLSLLPCETDGAGMVCVFGNFYIRHEDRHGRCRNIQHFKDFSEIKKGGFGTFYKAFDKDHNKWVILKSYDLDKYFTHDSFRIVLTEINTLQRMEHRNLVPLLEVISGEILESIWIRFDFYQYSLKDLFMFPSLLVPYLVKKILKEILSGLKYIHSSNYCHGNLNPENILFDSDGVLKLSDCANPDIYHETTPLDGSEIRDPVLNMTLENCVLRYKPLEILFGSKKQHPAIDMWAVGCIFAELLQKKPLFAQESVAAVSADIINLLGLPDDKRLPEFSKLLQRNNIKIEGAHRCTKLQKKFADQETTCLHLLAGLLVYNPEIRFTAEKCLMHPYFQEAPLAGTDEDLAHLLTAVQEETFQSN